MLSGFLSSEPGSLPAESNDSLLLIPPPFAFTPPELVVTSSSGSDAWDKPKPPMSDLNETSCLGLTQERRQRRKISNRESARRSRVRKQEYLQDLRTQVSQLKVRNRELVNRFRFALHQTQICCRQNECLRSEGVALCGKLEEMRHFLIDRQLQQHFLLNSAAIGDVYGHAFLKDSFSYHHNPLINHVI